MNIGSMANASTFIGHRKYFQQPTQVLAFFEAVWVTFLRLWSLFFLKT